MNTFNLHKPIVDKILEYTIEKPFILYVPKSYIGIVRAKSKQQIIHNWLLGKFDKYPALSRMNSGPSLKSRTVCYLLRARKDIFWEGDPYCNGRDFLVEILTQYDWSAQQIMDFVNYIGRVGLHFLISEQLTEPLEDF